VFSKKWGISCHCCTHDNCQLVKTDLAPWRQISQDLAVGIQCSRSAGQVESEISWIGTNTLTGSPVIQTTWPAGEHWSRMHIAVRRLRSSPFVNRRSRLATVFITVIQLFLYSTSLHGIWVLTAVIFWDVRPCSLVDRNLLSLCSGLEEWSRSFPETSKRIRLHPRRYFCSFVLSVNVSLHSSV
jgi:hypothetical protein